MQQRGELFVAGFDMEQHRHIHLQHAQGHPDLMLRAVYAIADDEVAFLGHVPVPLPDFGIYELSVIDIERELMLIEPSLQQGRGLIPPILIVADQTKP